MENTENYGQLWILCIAGGSGVGKTTVVKRLLKSYPDETSFSVSATTRLAGASETDGVDYYYYSLRQFNEMEQKGLFIETNPFATGHRYGTLLSELKRAREENKVMIVDCEVNGAMAIHKKYPGVTTCIFLDASDQEAEGRLQNAGTRKREKIPERIENLRKQRIIANESGIFQLVFDTTGIAEEIVFSVVNSHFLVEFETRKGLKVLR